MYFTNMYSSWQVTDPPGFVTKLKKQKRLLCKAQLRVIAALCLCACASAPALCQLIPPILGQTYSPTNPNVSGSTLPDCIARGDIVFMPYHGNTMWNNEQKFTAYEGFKIPSDEYNFVIAKNHTLDLLTNITDKDFTVFGNNYTPVSLGSNYCFSFSGDPTYPADSVIFHTQALYRSYSGIPVGYYPVCCTVTDLGELPLLGTGSVVDTAGASLDYNLYIVDFEEQERNIETADCEAVPISLKCIPSELPEKYALRIAVSWNTADSNLYTNSSCSCNEMITSNTGTSEKQWVYSAAPSCIYYSRPANSVTSEIITLKLIAADGAGSQVILSVPLTMTPSGSFTITSVNGGRSAGSDMKGYWDKSAAAPKQYTVYPNIEWKNDVTPLDGTAKDAPDMYFSNETDREYNRPFLYSINDSFVIHGGTIRHNDNITYSSSDYWLKVSASNQKLTNVAADTFTDSNGVITFGQISGNSFDKIEAGNVVISWKLVNKNTNQEINIGSTQHYVYVVGGTPETGNSIPYHTVVDISTKGAAGRIGNTDIAEGILNELKTKNLHRIDGEGPLKYWCNDTQQDELNHNSADELLATLDGDCYAWAELCEDMLLLQGVPGSLNILVLKRNQCYFGNNVIGFLQREQSVQGCNNLDLYENNKWFANHAIVQFIDSNNNYKYIDPGTAGGMHNSIYEYIESDIVYVLGVYDEELRAERTTGTVNANNVYIENAYAPDYFIDYYE